MLSTSASKASNIENAVTSLRYQIDWQIQSRRNIAGRLTEVVRALADVEYDIKDMHTFVNRAMRDYTDAENKIAKKADDTFNPEPAKVSDYLSEIGKGFMGLGAFLTAGSMLRFSKDLKFKFIEENGRILFKMKDAVIRPGNSYEYTNYRDQLARNFGGQSGDWKKRYVTRLIDEGMPLYDGRRIIQDNASKFLGNPLNSNEFGDLQWHINHLDDSKQMRGLKWAGKTFVDETIGMVDDFDWRGVSNYTKGAKALGILGTGLTVAGAWNDAFNSDNNLSTGDKWRQFGVDLTVDVGTGAGAMAVGAFAGSFILPPAGTIIGAGIGAGLNVLINVPLINGKSVVDYTKDVANEFIDNTVDAVTDFAGDVASGIGRTLDKIFW